MASARVFRLAPMSPLIFWLTLALWALPAGLALAALLTPVPGLGWVASLLLATYVAAWLAARPSHFEVTGRGLDVVFPAWRRTIAAGSPLRVRTISAQEFRQEFGWALRIGVGGLWGAFGWLWTSRRGVVEIYVSRVDDLVLVESDDLRPLILTPESPRSFMDAIQGQVNERARRPA